MNLAGVIASLATGTYTVTRTAAGDYGDSGLPAPLPLGTGGPDGRYRAGSTTTFPIAAVIEPVTGRNLLRLPEGLRTKELISIWTATPLQTATAPDGAIADRLAYRGKTYQVQTVEFWDEAGNYYEAIAAKVGQ